MFFFFFIFSCSGLYLNYCKEQCFLLSYNKKQLELSKWKIILSKLLRIIDQSLSKNRYEIYIYIYIPKTPDFNPRSRRQLYQVRTRPSIMAPNIAPQGQPGLNDTNYGTPLPQPCPPPSSLSATAWKNRSKAPSRKVTIHCPALRCDSLKERPMTTSKRKRVYWQLKTEIRRVYVVKQKQKYNSDFCSR